MPTRSQISSTSPSKCEVQKDRLPLRLEPRHDRPNLASSQPGQRHRRLIEKDDLRVVHHRLGQAEAFVSCLWSKCGSCNLCGQDAHQFQHLRDAFLAALSAHADERAVELEQAVAGMVVGKR